MRARAKSREFNAFGLSFLDVLANTIGGLAFLLILAVLMIKTLVYTPPSILTEALPDGHDGMPYLLWLSAQEGLGKYRWSLDGGEVPAGLTLDETTGRLSGVPRALRPGGKHTFVFDVRCESPGEAGGATRVDRRRFSLVVHAGARADVPPLRIRAGSTLPAAARGQPYPLVLAVEGGQPPYRWAAGAGLPAGMQLGADGSFQGSPTAAGDFRFGVDVTTAGGERASAQLALTVKALHDPPPPVPPLTIKTTRLPAAVALREYVFQPAAEGGRPPYLWRAVSAQPGWLQGAGGGFSGTPALPDIGETRVVWEVEDQARQTARTEPLLLQVLAPTGNKPQPLRIKTRLMPDARAGQAYGLAIAVEGGVAPYAFENIGDLESSGLTFSAKDGSVEGTPHQAGAVRLAINVSDALGQKAAATLALRVRPAVAAPQILTRAAPGGRVGTPFDFALSAIGGHPPYRWLVLEGALPRGVQLEEQSGRIVGIPAEAGSHRVRVGARDAEGVEAPEKPLLDFAVLTEGGHHKLVVATRALPTLLAGDATDLSLAAEGGMPPYRWQVPGLTEGLRVEDTHIAGRPVRAGTSAVELVVNDASGQRAAVTMSLTVLRVAPFWALVAALALLVAMLACLAWALRRLGRRQPLRILTDELPNARASFPYAVQLACIGGVPPYRWSVSGGRLPDGMTLSPEGRLTGVPYRNVPVSKTLERRFTVEVSDASGARAEREL